MATPDLGPERPDLPSETRQLVESARTAPGGKVSGRSFWVALAVIAVAVGLFALALRTWT